MSVKVDEILDGLLLRPSLTCVESRDVIIKPEESNILVSGVVTLQQPGNKIDPSQIKLSQVKQCKIELSRVEHSQECLNLRSPSKLNKADKLPDPKYISPLKTLRKVPLYYECSGCLKLYPSQLSLKNHSENCAEKISGQAVTSDEEVIGDEETGRTREEVASNTSLQVPSITQTTSVQVPCTLTSVQVPLTQTSVQVPLTQTSVQEPLTQTSVPVPLTQMSAQKTSKPKFRHHCRVCSKGFTLKRHLIEHFPGSSCYREMVTAGSSTKKEYGINKNTEGLVASHVLTGKMKPAAKGVTSVGKFLCNVCGRLYTSNRSLLWHFNKYCRKIIVEVICRRESSGECSASFRDCSQCVRLLSSSKGELLQHVKKKIIPSQQEICTARNKLI